MSNEYLIHTEQKPYGVEQKLSNAEFFELKAGIDDRIWDLTAARDDKQFMLEQFESMIRNHEIEARIFAKPSIDGNALRDRARELEAQLAIITAELANATDQLSRLVREDYHL